jgi:hypothetical protein
MQTELLVYPVCKKGRLIPFREILWAPRLRAVRKYAKIVFHLDKEQILAQFIRERIDMKRAEGLSLVA